MKDPNSQNSTSPKTELPWYRQWLANVWHTRGGGLYACGYAATFIFLEVRTIVSEVAESESIGQFFSEQLIEFFFRFFGESLSNMIHAFIWPVEIVKWWPPYGAIGLGLAFVAFPMYIKKPVEHWLFGDENT